MNTEYITIIRKYVNRYKKKKTKKKNCKFKN